MIQWNRIFFDDDELPEPDDITEESNPYYFIFTKYGAQLAMYLVDENGSIGWYTNYGSKVVCEVTAWSSINRP